MRLREVANHQNPMSLDQMLFDDLGSLYEQRIRLDRQIINWIGELSEGDLDFVLSYHYIKGIHSKKRYSSLVLHFFNHQTHHRGQVSTLLSQVGMDIGITDLLDRIPEETDI